MSDNQPTDATQQAVASGGAYEVLRKRLTSQGTELNQLTGNINESRQAEFGSTDMALLGRFRLRTENNCDAQDLVLVSDYVLFGYNAYLGLRNETKLEDVFGLYKLVTDDDGQYDVEEVSFAGTFLADQQFVGDFRELYSYYKDTVLSQLVVKDGKLLISFQIGERLTDIRVFRFTISADGKTIEYIDNRGERDIALPPKYDFEWQRCDRAQVIEGRYPHINVLDTLFIDNLRGDLTIKIEDNTQVGQGLYAEPVDDDNQSLDDGEFYYADLNSLIVLKIRPYMEQQWRYLVYNRKLESIMRIDAIDDSCVQLPEDHGIIFPGGMYLTTGEYKQFDDALTGLQFKRSFRSPNGEDVMFIFYHPDENIVALYGYNLINKSLQNPILGHGFGFYDDGRLVIFYAQDEATRVHPVQIWQTPYFSDNFASEQPVKQSFYGKIGNAELVRGISELYSISRSVLDESASARHFNDLSKVCHKVFDTYHWLESEQLEGISAILKQISSTSELVLDEYEKVESIRRQSSEALTEASSKQQQIINDIAPDGWRSPNDFVSGLSQVRHQRGHLLTIAELRYMDSDKIDELEQQISEVEQQLNLATVDFLAKDEALQSYYDDLQQVDSGYQDCQTTVELQQHVDSLGKMADGLDLLSELMATLKVPDATIQTKIIEAVSELYGKLNQQKAKVEQQRKSFGAAEASAQFAAQFKLLNQSIHNALGLATTPDKCDEQLSRLIVQLEELEGQFSEHDEFLSDILGKRDEIFETFESHKQQLTDQRQRKCQTLFDAAERLVQSVSRRSQKFTELDELNTFFASDGLISKLRELTETLREFDDNVKADDIDAKVKGAKAQAVRALKDKSEIYEEGGNVIKLGPRHKFSVNSQELDLTLLVRGGQQHIHLIGTDFYQAINDETLDELKPYWDIQIPSESEHVYRGEFLAYSVIEAAQNGQENLSLDKLYGSEDEAQILTLVRQYAAPRFNDGYEKGIHDHDAAKLLADLLPALKDAGTLKFSPLSRAIAIMFWQQSQSNKLNDSLMAAWPSQANNALTIAQLFSDTQAKSQLQTEIAMHISDFIEQQALPCSAHIIGDCAGYLIEEIGQSDVSFATSKYARALTEQFSLHLKSQSVTSTNAWDAFEQALQQLDNAAGKRWALTYSYLDAYVKSQNLTEYQHFIPEAVALIAASNDSQNLLARTDKEINLQLSFNGLLGQHSRVQNGELTLALDEFLQRLNHHKAQVASGFTKLQQARQQVIEHYRHQLRLEEFKPKPLSSFVRNQLINKVYLPIIGDNLAKQMGTVGDSKRTDLMGLLLMISPPGYGKTTLIEYVANRLGLIFMKINCPTVGHEVTSIDPSQASHSGAKQELEKLNLALEMGNNVMLYLDDIQHTNPEFLQQFISLCDGTRRIEGVWNGRSKTYDMRGKKFCICMAGNPYTESGEAFKIPDMLANRADIYNLGDVLGDSETVFNLSYIENSLTSNAVLAPLATRDMNDVYKFVDMAKGANVATTDLGHQYSGAEVKEITDVIEKMLSIQQVVSKVNAQYIASSAQNDQYRTEPPFKLQGSYRNMNKMAEKISAVMTDDELMQMIADHYVGEAQLLTLGAEENLLKLAELRGNMTDAEATRWQDIKQNYLRNKSLGGDESDTGAQMVLKLHDLVENLGAVKNTLNKSLEQTAEQRLEEREEQRLEQAQQASSKQDEPATATISPVNPVEQLSATLEPLLALLGRSAQDIDKLSEQLDQLNQLGTQLKALPVAQPQPLSEPNSQSHSQPQETTIEPVQQVTEQIAQVTPDAQQLMNAMAGTFAQVIESLVKDLQPAKTNKYLEAAKSILDEGQEQ